ncbi:MAG: hydrogenase maturation protease [Candidatus Bathyarchaeia archaeon]
MAHKNSKPVVIGVGNVLLSDEGVGIHIVRQLKKRDISKLVEIHEIGTSSFELLNVIEGNSRVIIVDAVRMDEKPGTVKEIDLVIEDDISLLPQFTSLHQLDLISTLKMAKGVIDLPKKIVLIGIEPASLDAGIELSKLVETAIPNAISEIIKSIDKMNLNLNHQDSTSKKK